MNKVAFEAAVVANLAYRLGDGGNKWDQTKAIIEAYEAAMAPVEEVVEVAEVEEVPYVNPNPSILEVAVLDLLEVIKNDFGNIGSIQYDRFAEGLKIKTGPKYIKIISSGSAWGFIVKKDGGKFKAGDILYPASWGTPAKNAARGNILKGGYSVSWTGPNYLR
jgi:hypothetical protein